MWSRRRFLESMSALPLVGGFVGAGATEAGAATMAAKGARDYFKELGVRPFINAAGTYTAMTASLMPPEVMDAINYASKHYVMLDELHDKVGERLASLVHAEAAMVTCGAASALTLGTAAVLTGTDRQKMVDLPDLTSMKSEVIIQKAHRFGYDHAVRNCGVKLVEVETREDLERAVNAEDGDDALLQQQQQGRADPGRGVRPARQEARRADVQRRRSRRASRGQPLEVHEDGLRSRGVLGRQGHARAAERRPAARPQGPHRRRAVERAAERQHRRARHEGEQGRDARPARGHRDVSSRRTTRRSSASSRSAPRKSRRARPRSLA